MAKDGKKPRKSVTLFTKYITFFAAIEIISLTAFGCVICYFVADTWEDDQKQKLLGYAVNISNIYEDYLSHSEGSDKNDAFSGVCYSVASVASAANADIFITDTGGNIVVCKEAGDEKSVCSVHEKIKIPGEIYTGILADGVMATSGNLGGAYDEEDYLLSACAVKNPATGEDVGIVYAVQSLEKGLTPYLTRFLQIYIMAALVLLIVTGLIMYVSTYNMTKPLRDISEATQRYSNGDFSYRLKCDEDNTVREFDELCASINSMAESLQQYENSRTNFVANVSHELKTPMTTIGGFIDGILDGTIDYKSQEKYLRIVSDEIKRLSRIVVSMLNISKMEAGEMRINTSRFNLTQQILSIFISFEQTINDKDITVRGIEYLKNNYIEADPDMINQVFYNLIDNAVKFTQQGGEIVVLADSGEEFVTVSIKNTGKGIDSEDIDHVFERFYKGDKSRSIDSKSAGLGLFIVKSIVKLHNGEISVSNDEMYTQFTVKLRTKLIGI